eukprot:TRINITY_DN1093_c0_g1_i1.p1 TRINITY_DN1093_c0_g1~~TRINITY_DN1093_c0_g1_i1.p1  ORF type:complete len:440 (-),score=125.65 TRINITY_DN1093_c0_g1_i1:189-1406(-)
MDAGECAEGARAGTHVPVEAMEEEEEEFHTESDLDLLGWGDQESLAEGADMLEFFIRRGFLQQAKKKVDEITSSRIREPSTRIKEKFKKKKEELASKMQEAPFIRAVDKLSFIVGILFMISTQYIMLRFPEYMPQYYIWCTILLMVFRFISYHKAKFHYFILDYCYYNCMLCIFFLFYYPQSELLFQIVFAMSNGPVIWSIYMWKNKLVFHDVDKMTSFCIHFLPPLTTYCLRWSPGGAHSEAVSPGLFAFVTKTLYFYFFWQVCYLLKTEWVDRNKLQKDEKIMTSARWMTKRQPHPIYSWVCHNQHSIPWGTTIANHPAVLLCTIQVVYTLITVLPMPLLYNSWWVHGGVLLFNLVVAISNGATYYFDVFSENYKRRLEKMIASSNTRPIVDESKSAAAVISS